MTMTLQCDRALEGAEMLWDRLDALRGELLQCDRALEGAEMALAVGVGKARYAASM